MQAEKKLIKAFNFAMDIIEGGEKHGACEDVQGNVKETKNPCGLRGQTDVSDHNGTGTTIPGEEK